MMNHGFAILFALALLCAGCAADPCELDPDSPDPVNPIAEEHYLAAMSLCETGDLVDANDECEIALEYQPDHARALALLYKVRFLLNRHGTPPPHANSRLYERPQ